MREESFYVNIIGNSIACTSISERAAARDESIRDKIVLDESVREASLRDESIPRGTAGGNNSLFLGGYLETTACFPITQSKHKNLNFTDSWRRLILCTSLIPDVH